MYGILGVHHLLASLTSYSICQSSTKDILANDLKLINVICLIFFLQVRIIEAEARRTHDHRVRTEIESMIDKIKRVMEAVKLAAAETPQQSGNIANATPAHMDPPVRELPIA